MVSRTPQYGRCRPASTKASLTGKGNNRVGTRPEKLLINALRKLGIRVKRPNKFLPGNPDIVFWKHQLVVFCDGDFWHGKNWHERRIKLKTGANPVYWVKKIEYNRMRDKMNNRILRVQGWEVIRIWESLILKSPEKASEKIAQALERKREQIRNGSK